MDSSVDDFVLLSARGRRGHHEGIAVVSDETQ